MAVSSLLAVEFKRGGRCGQPVGAHQHDAVARGERFEILAGAVARHIHQGAIAGAARHPGRSIEHDDVVAAGLRGAAQAQLRDGQQQQRHADELQQQGPRLLNPAAPRGDRRLLGGHPEAQGGDHQLAARAVEQVERHRNRGDAAEDRQELKEREIQEIHGGAFRRSWLRYRSARPTHAIPRARMRSPKITLSRDCEVAMPA